ncbi:GNAT family N-acetyltransferase [Proteiniborus sp. MB09-C3]|uniref:GNAT family N-acetyltransferase n=1 Tax=Proteiniborus sp. MB09-C3 TaxID=3050072 RepID=UPI0025571D37|nr:GNAT family N-acetyltransferase [Proteiniborus sp. MB09-C3]WIV11046.1 GNAT family N-acetyltransferase [Proteiniborus sp. MB09-C3]
MNIHINELSDDLFFITAGMITELMNYHRKLNNAPKEYWQTDEQSQETLKDWIEEGTVYNIFLDDEPVGFFYVRLGGQDVAWLEDLFILEGYRDKGIGKYAMQRLDELMIEKNVVAIFVDVVPRNIGAIKLYRDFGFNHLNLIQLRKNYDRRLDKNEDVEILGFNFKKY